MGLGDDFWVWYWGTFGPFGFALIGLFVLWMRGYLDCICVGPFERCKCGDEPLTTPGTIVTWKKGRQNGLPMYCPAEVQGCDDDGICTIRYLDTRAEGGDWPGGTHQVPKKELKRATAVTAGLFQGTVNRQARSGTGLGGGIHAQGLDYVPPVMETPP